MAADVFRGNVTRVDAEGVWLQIPALGSDLEFGPSSTVTDVAAMTPGARVLVSTVTGTFEDVVVLGVLDQDIGGDLVATVWRTGAAVPDNAIGEDADFYLRTNGDYYERVSGAYVLRGSLLGPASTTPGPAGPQGPSGDIVYDGDRNFLQNATLDLPGPGGATLQLNGYSSFWAGGGASTNRETDPTKIHSGIACARADMPASSFSRLQQIAAQTVVEGEVMTLTCWAKTDTPGATSTINLTFMFNTSPVLPDFFTTPATTLVGITYTLDGTWRKYEWTGVVPAGIDLCRAIFTMQNTGATVVKTWVDDIAMFRESAPSGQALKIRTFTERARAAIGGGGIRICEVAAGVGQVWWTEPLMLQNIGRSPDTSTTGEMSLVCPVNGVVVPGYGGAANQTVAGSRIPLPDGCTLYWEYPLAGVFSSLQYRIVGHTADFDVPPNWVPIVTYDAGLTESFYWGDGQSMSPWHNVGAAGEPAFAGAWTNYGAPFMVCRFRRMNGVVYGEGLAKSGAAGTIYTLPAGYRPSATLIKPIMSANVVARLDIAATGTVAWTVAGNNSYVELNFSFPADA